MSQKTSVIETAAIRIATSTTVSSAVEADRFEYFGIVIPTVFEGTAITFQVSADGVTYADLYDTSNGKVSVTVAAGRNYDLPASLRAWPFFKVVSGTAVAHDRFLAVVMKG